VGEESLTGEGTATEEGDVGSIYGRANFGNVREY